MSSERLKRKGKVKPAEVEPAEVEPAEVEPGKGKRQKVHFSTVLGRTMSGTEITQDEKLQALREMVKKHNPNAMVYDPRLAGEKPIFDGKRQEYWPIDKQHFQSEDEFKKAVAAKFQEKGYNIKWDPSLAGSLDNEYTISEFVVSAGQVFMKLCKKTFGDEVGATVNTIFREGAFACFVISLGTFAGSILVDEFRKGGKSRRRNQKKSKRKVHKNRKTKKNTKRT